MELKTMSLEGLYRLYVVVWANQDVDILGALLDSGRSLAYSVQADRHLWIQLVKGQLNVNGVNMEAGDGAALSDEKHVTLLAAENSEVLIFDLA